MVWKTARAGSIANAGKMTVPGFVAPKPTWGTDTPAKMWAAWHDAMTETPGSAQYDVEASRIPLYLGTESPAALDPLLDYEDWDSVDIPPPAEDDITMTVSMRVSQDYPLRIPLHEAFYAGDSVKLEGEVRMENHYPTYLEGIKW